MRPCIGEEGIARLSVNTLELAGGFTVIFPVLLAHALLPSHCFPRFTQSLAHKNEVLLLLFWQSSARDILFLTGAVFLTQELLF